MRKIITNSFFVRVFGLGLGIGLGMAGMLFFLPGHSIATSQYDKPLQSLQDSIALYHKNINDLFNARMKLLVSGKGDNTIPYDYTNNIPDATNGTDADGNAHPCNDQNVTTFCLATAALDEFIDFQTVMKERALRFWDESTVDDQTSFTINDAMLTSALRSKAIADEVAAAKNALDRSLAAYNQLHVAYPLHQQYKQIIIDLTKYRDALSSVRNEIENYPSKLLDATTPSCG